MENPNVKQLTTTKLHDHIWNKVPRLLSTTWLVDAMYMNSASLTISVPFIFVIYGAYPAAHYCFGRAQSDRIFVLILDLMTSSHLLIESETLFKATNSKQSWTKVLTLVSTSNMTHKVRGDCHGKLQLRSFKLIPIKQNSMSLLKYRLVPLGILSWILYEHSSHWKIFRAMIFLLPPRQQSCGKVMFFPHVCLHVCSRGLHLTITHDALDLTVQPHCTASWTSDIGLPHQSRPSHLCYWHLVDIIGDLFKLASTGWSAYGCQAGGTHPNQMCVLWNWFKLLRWASKIFESRLF